MTTLAEERVLRPLDPIPNDVNDWPDFALRDVKIFYQGKGRYADLLEASSKVPLCVLGELMPLEDEQEALALIENPEHTRMKIDNVSNYSFGQDDNGKPVVWAAGKAGWYEITPSDRYLQHYNDTIEAIDLFYFMVDQYQKLPPKRKRLGFQIDPFLTAYQKHTDFRVDDDDEAMETIHKHHKFILKQMIEEREGIDWSQTHLWNHLAETYADEVERLKANIVAPVIEESADSSMDSSSTTSSESSSRSASQSSEEMEVLSNGVQSNEITTTIRTSESGSESDEPGPEPEPESESESESESDSKSESRPKSESKSEAESEDEESSEEEEEDQTDWTRPIFDLLNILRKQSTFDIRNCGIEDVAFEVQKMPAFPGNHKQAIAAMERFAEPLLRLMNEAKLRKKFNWSTRNIYAELEATLADEIADDIKTPAGKRSKDKHRMKSVLRPSGASKSKKRTRSAQDAEGEDEEMMDEMPPTASSPIARRQPYPKHLARNVRQHSADTAGSREDSPSRQLNGHFNANALPELPPAPEAQEMIDLVMQEAKRVGRQHQTGNLQAFLGTWEW